MIARVMQAVRGLLEDCSAHPADADEELSETLTRIRRGLNALNYYEAKRYWLASRECLALVPLEKDLADYASEAFGNRQEMECR